MDVEIMNKYALGLLFIFSLTLPAFAQNLSVDTAVIAQSINEWHPGGVGSIFSPDIEKLYCFTKISEATPATHITHVWYWKDQEMARIVLPVKAKTWRTFSSKTILPRWSGDWHVAIVHGEAVVETVSFKIE